MHKAIFSTSAAFVCAAIVNATPVQARYLQTDPIGYEDQVNLYAYVGNDPVNTVDPSGKELVLIGTRDERRLLDRAIRQVARSSPEMNARYEQMRDSPLRISNSITSGRSDSANARFTRAENQWNGVGNGSDNHINPNEKGWDQKQTDVYTIVAHEVFGHSWERMNGDLHTNDMVDSRTSAAEVSAVETENIYRANTGGVGLRENYGSTPVRTDDIISSGGCKGVRSGNLGSGAQC